MQQRELSDRDQKQTLSEKKDISTVCSLSSSPSFTSSEYHGDNIIVNNQEDIKAMLTYLTHRQGLGL